MRMPLTAISLILACAGQAAAQSCEERFVHVMTGRDTTSPVRLHVTQEIVGGMKSTNWNFQDGKGNWRTEMIDPETMAWSMVVDNILYSSSDKGATWQKVREMDAAASPQAVADMQAERARTVRNAECGEAELDGRTLQTLAAEYDMQGGYLVHNKYWFDPDADFVPRTETRLKGNGFESFTVQLAEPAPGLVIEKPE